MIKNDGRINISPTLLTRRDSGPKNVYLPKFNTTTISKNI